MTDFVSLTTALDGWFDKPLSELPKHLQERVRKDFFPMPWESLSSEQRQSVARQWDYNHDPATEQDRQFWWDFFIKIDELEKQIEQWASVAAPTAAELARKESRLKELRGELARMQRQQEHARGDYLPTAGHSSSASPNAQGRYIAYPKAMRRLAERLAATPEELAAWIFMGPKDGGIAAYRNANELDPPPRFYFVHFMGEDYLSTMMACWFLEDDIEGFNPVDRYITGKALIERWSKQSGLQLEAFIQAKIAESRLIDLHPIYGGTRGTFSEHDTFPPLETGLFVLAHVEEIEAEDFGCHHKTPSGESAHPCKAVSAAEIRRHFRVFPEQGANIDWWKKLMRGAKRNGLGECRIGQGKTGPGGSLWRPDLVAAWLVDRHAKGREGLPSTAAGGMLKRFPGCAETAETMFPADE